MTTKHTPGPWQFCESELRPGRYSIYANGPVAYCGDTTNEPGDGEANARLIAAAPELLAALDKAESFIAGFEGDELQEGIDEMLSEIRAAIAKAEGGQ